MQPTAQQIEAANEALINEAVKNVHSGATRTSTKMLYPRGTVSVYHAGHAIRVMVNYGGTYALGTVKKDGSIKWDDIPQRTIVARLGRLT